MAGPGALFAADSLGLRGSMRKFTRISVERGGYPIFPSGDRAVGTTQPTYGDGTFLRPPRLCGETIMTTDQLGLARKPAKVARSVPNPLIQDRGSPADFCIFPYELLVFCPVDT